MADDENLAFGRMRPSVERCWMCGSRLPVAQMVADGGNACGSLRWYCLDVRGCTERWTARVAPPDSARGGDTAAATQAGL